MQSLPTEHGWFHYTCQTTDMEIMREETFGPYSGIGSRMGQEGFLHFFRQKAYIANTIKPLMIDDFAA